MADKILLTLSARYLASRLQQRLQRAEVISEEANAAELADLFKAKRTVLNARLKELKDDKKVVAVSAGNFKIAAYSIRPLVDRLEAKTNG